jgi:tetratricopeptide (TPR) repeat protein
LLAELLTGKPPEKDQARRTDAEWESGLRKALGADLAAIIGKARRQEPGERYASVAALAEDLNRYLRGLPVSAHRGAWLGRAGKFARRYRGRLAAAALALAAAAALLVQMESRRQERIRRANELYAMVIRQGESIGGNVAGNRPELAYEVWRGLRDSVETLRREDPGNPRVSDLLAHCYMQLGELAWFRYGPSLMDADAALESYQRARSLLENTSFSYAFTLFLGARMYGSDILIEKGRGFDSFREVAQLLADGEARRKVDATLRKLLGEAELASYYDMLSDRLGANMSWPTAGQEQAPRWRTELAKFRPYGASDSIAAAVYQEALAAPPDSSDVNKALIRFQLGRLQHQAGLRERGILTLRESLKGMLEGSPSMPPSDYQRGRVGGAHLRLSSAEEEDGNLAEALREREEGMAILEEQFAGNPLNLYLKERAGEARMGMARLLARSGRNAEAARAARSGLELLDENARAPRTAAVTLDLTAQRWLTVEPAGLRDPGKALEYARRAVEQTAGQMPAYLETLAFAQDAAGLHDEAAQTAKQAIQGTARCWRFCVRYSSRGGMRRPIACLEKRGGNWSSWPPDGSRLGGRAALIFRLIRPDQDG